MSNLDHIKQLAEGLLILAGNGTVWSALHIKLDDMTGILEAVAPKAAALIVEGKVLVRHSDRAALDHHEMSRLIELGWMDGDEGWRWSVPS